MKVWEFLSIRSVISIILAVPVNSIPPLPHPQPIMGKEVVIHIVNYFSGPMKLGLSTSFVSFT